MPRHMLKDETAEIIEQLIGDQGGPGRILEVGTGWAESTEFFSQLKPGWKIYTVDAFGLYGDGRIYQRMEHEKVATINAKITKLGNVIQILGDSSKIPWELPIDLYFHDGDHTYDGVRQDWIRYSPWIKPGGFAVFDDYHQENNPANGVKRFVEQVLQCEPHIYELMHAGYYCAVLRKTTEDTMPPALKEFIKEPLI